MFNIMHMHVMFRLVGGDASPTSPPPKSATGTQPKYCDFSTNTMRRYWSWILRWQYYLSLPDIGMYFSVNTMHKSSLKLVWKYGRLSSLPFLKSSIPFHSGIFHIPYRNFRSIPFHTMPCRHHCKWTSAIATVTSASCNRTRTSH